MESIKTRKTTSRRWPLAIALALAGAVSRPACPMASPSPAAAGFAGARSRSAPSGLAESRPGAPRELTDALFILRHAGDRLKLYEAGYENEDAYAADAGPSLDEIRDIAAALRILAESSGSLATLERGPEIRSEAHVLLAWAEGIVARESWFWQRVAPARRSFVALQASVADDPTNSIAWCAYGLALFGIHESWFSGTAQRALDLDLASEMYRAVTAMSRLPESLQLATMTGLLLDALASDAALSPHLVALREHIREELPDLRRTRADEIPLVDGVLNKLHRLVAANRSAG